MTVKSPFVILGSLRKSTSKHACVPVAMWTHVQIALTSVQETYWFLLGNSAHRRFEFTMYSALSAPNTWSDTWNAVNKAPLLPASDWLHYTHRYFDKMSCNCKALGQPSYTKISIHLEKRCVRGYISGRLKTMWNITFQYWRPSPRLLSWNH